jgi:hypothetical protein
MSVSTGLYALLGSVSGITDLIGSGDAMRAWPAMIPQGVTTFPAVRYNHISGSFERSLVGPVEAAESTYQIDVVDSDYADALAAAHAIRVGVDGYTGAPTTGEFFYNIIVENLSAPFELPPDASEAWRWIISLDVRIFHTINTS